MDERTAARLLLLNREFYQTFALSFSETRRRLQPGVMRLLAHIRPQQSVLDLGCGNGALARALADAGHKALYVGMDASQALLATAQRDQAHPAARFELADLADPAWHAVLSSPFEVIAAFAVLHHIPGDALRLRLAAEIRSLLAESGWLALSVWDFLGSARLAGRVVDWDAVDVATEDVDDGDYLLDWRRGGRGLRYVHHFSEDELTDLARRSGFAVERTFSSDGEGGKLGLYQVWRLA